MPTIGLGSSRPLGPGRPRRVCNDVDSSQKLPSTAFNRLRAKSPATSIGSSRSSAMIACQEEGASARTT
eukprot:6894591-Prymnesium_polylepis.1